MPKYRITDPSGQTYEVNAPEGASEDDVMAYAQRSFKLAKAPAPSKPFGQRLNESIADIPRQLGLFGRAALQGVGGLADLAATPARAALNLLPGVNIQPGVGQAAANLLQLPQPRDATERIVQDATSMLAGGAVPIAAGARLAQNATGVTQGVGRLLASNPGAQLASAVAAGGAGGYTRETGGNEGSQLAASLAAGVATPMALSGAQRLAGAAARAVRPPAIPPIQVDVTINNALRDSGFTLDQLPAQVAQGIRRDVSEALKISENLSPDAVRRLADYRLTGLTPTRAKLTQDVADITRQANLSKLGANSADPSAQALARLENENARLLTAGLNTLGANTADDQIAGAQRVMGALDARNQQAQRLISERYAAARATDGRAAQLDPSAFTRKANDLLDEALLGGKLPSDVRNLLNRAATGEMPLTVDVAEQFKTRIGELQRATIDRAEKKALGLVRSALDDAPLLPGQDIGQESINAFNQARALNRKWMGIVEKTPALQAIRDGVEPDKFVEQFIVGRGPNANVMDVARLKSSIKADPNAMQAVKEQIVSHLKSKALSGSADETGNFSQSAYNKALNSIGERKLKLFFSADDINQLKALGRVAAYEQFQPRGSAVNNSNTAGAVGNILERIGGSSLLGKIPFGRAAIGEPLQNIAIGMQSARALSAPQSLTLPQAPGRAAGQTQGRGMLLSPAAFIQQPEDEDQRRLRQLGLIP